MVLREGASGPTKLAFTTPARSGVVNDCLGPITVQTQNASDVATNPTSNTEVTLATDASGSFFSDAACTIALTEANRTIPTSANSFSFYYKPTARGTGSHQITATAAPLTQAQQTQTVNKADQVITFTSTAPTDAVYDDTYVPAATGGGSGNPVTFGASGACSYSGGTVTMDGVGTCTVTADQAGNDDYNAATQATQIFSVGKATATITLSDLTHTYDGSPKYATVTTNPAGLEGDVTVTYEQGGNPVTDPTDAGSYDVTATLDHPNYQATPAEDTLVINQAGATITIDAGTLSHTYDGNSTAVTATTIPAGLSYSVEYEQGGSPVTDPTNAGSYDVTVTITDPNYSGTDTSTLVIDPKEITGAFTADDKVYDGNDSATILTRTLDGVVGDDDVELVGGTATFDDKNVGDNKEVTGTGFSLSGDDADNYTLASTTLTTTADITAKQITVSFTVDNKEYDGTADATITGSSMSGEVENDDVTLVDSGATAAFDDKNVGDDKTVTGTGFTLDGADAGNYSILVNTTTADITPLEITGSFTAKNKVYDGNTDAEIDTRDLSGEIETDDVELDGGTASFDTADIGTGKEVTGTGFSLSGDDAGNYTLASSTLTTTANITAREITGSFTAANKVYDGTDEAQITGFELDETPIGDVTLDGANATATFNTKDVGDGKTVTSAGFELSGANAGNYTLTMNTTTADITPKGLTITADNKSKVYDGDPYSPFTVAYDGFVDGEDESVLGGTLSFTGDAVGAVNAGLYTITPQGLTSSNYNIIFENGELEIEKADQEISFDSPGDKTYGDPAFLVSGTSDSGLNVSFSVDGDCTIDGSNMVSIEGAGSCTITATQTGNLNYNAAEPVEHTITIAKATLTVTAENKNKTYDGAIFPYGDYTIAYSGFVYDEDESVIDETGLEFTGTAITAVDAGGYTITPGGLASDNYAFSYQNGTLTIDKADQVITFTSTAPTGAVYNDTYEPEADGGGSGEPVTFGASGACSYSDGTVTMTSVGDCTVTANQAGNNNYNAAPQATQVFGVEKADQTITFDQPASPATFGTTFNVDPTSTSGLDVTVAASGGCTVAPGIDSGWDVTMTSGTTDCVLTASQAGNENYNGALDVQRTVAAAKANQATLSVTAPDSGIYGEALEMTADGGSGTGALSFAVVAGSDACEILTGGPDDGKLSITSGTGTCQIEATKAADNNYNATTSAAHDVAIGQASQTITFDQPASPAVYNTTFAVSASSDSGLDVEIVASGVCTIDNGTVTMTSGTGDCVLTAKQAGDDNYAAATNVERTVAAAKADQTITFDALPGKTYGDAPFDVSASSDSGLAVSFGVTGNCTIASATVTITGAGSCEVTASQVGDANYNGATPVARSFDIAAKGLTVTADNKSKVYDGNPFTSFTVSYDGFAYDEDESVLGGTLSFTGDAVGAVDAGFYTITPQGLTSSNYTIQFVNGELEIEKAPQVIVFAPLANKDFGNPPFNVSATGGPSGNPVTFSLVDSDGVCTIAGATVTITGVGVCTVRASQAGNANYLAAEDVDRSFSIGDVTAPVISGMPSNMTVHATSSSGAQVSWTAPTALDDVDGPVEVVCVPPSGSTFPIGQTTVTCTATDAAQNQSQETFTIDIVRDMLQACLYAGSLSQVSPLAYNGTPSANCGRGTLVLIFQGWDYFGCNFAGSLTQVGTSQPSSCGRGVPVGMFAGTDLYGCLYAGSLTQVGTSVPNCSRGYAIGFERAYP